MDQKILGIFDPNAKLFSFVRRISKNRRLNSVPPDGSLPRHVPALPYDLWNYISNFVPRDQLRDLFSVNRAFFHAAMNERYAKIGDYDGETWLRNSFYQDSTLEGLRNPEVASRVRTLNIKPRLLQWASDREKYHQKFYLRWARKLRMLIDAEFARKVRDAPSFTKSMLEALSGLKCVTDYEIDWRLKGDCAPETKIPILFLAAAWPVFGANLCRLSLTATMAYLDTIVAKSSGVEFKNLQALRLKMKTNDCDQDRRIMEEVVAQFVNRAQLTLNHLSIGAYGPISLDPLLSKLGRFPLLRHIELDILSDRRTVPNPSAITPFLRDHASSLEHLTFRSSHATSGTAQAVHDWFAHELAAIPFVSLISFEFHIPDEPDVDSPIPSSSTFIRPFANTIRSLILEGQALSFREVSDITELFRHRPKDNRLRVLRLQVQKLSPELFDLLATNLPALETLDLAYKEIVGGEAETVPSGRSEEELFAEMQKRQYPSWQLNDIAIWHNLDGRMWMVWQWKIMQLLAKCVPSIRSFREQGHMVCGERGIESA